MKILSTYSAKIKEYRHIFKDSVRIYRSAVNFFINVCLKEWELISVPDKLTERKSLVESVTVSTKERPDVPYPFGTKDHGFYKFPCYLRRAAIAEAISRVSSYKSNLANWEVSDTRTRGEKPSYPKAGHCYPVFYRDNMFIRKDDYTTQLKVFRNNTWDWITVQLRKSDVDYILHHCRRMKECAPTLMKRGRQWYLDFPFEEKSKLKGTHIMEQLILSVDLGINSSATCSVLSSGGTVLGRHFLKLPKEYDSLNHKIDHIKRAQRHGSRKVSNLWAYAKGVNDDIAVKTAKFIMDTAILYDVDCIVFEHLDVGRKKRGSRKQRLALWKARYVQSMVTHKAHVNGMHVSHVNAWGTSKLAFDGSGTVLRGNKSTKTNDNYSLCEFQNGKLYNCDLSASYNIGARYFVREILKTLPARDRQRIEAKVPGCAKRNTCTLATLISLNGEFHAAV